MPFPDLAAAMKRPSGLRGKLPEGIAFLSGALPDGLLRTAATSDAPAEAIILSGAMSEADFYARLAAHIGVAVLDGTARLADGVDWHMAWQVGHAELMDGRILVAPRGAAIVELLRHFPEGLTRERLCIASPSDFETWLLREEGAAIAAHCADKLAQTWPDRSAKTLMSVHQQITAGILAALALTGIVTSQAIWIVLCLALGFLMMLAVLLRLAATCIGAFTRLPAAPLLTDDTLPRYTILVALHREANVIAQLIEALSAIDYPRDRLDVLFLLEAGDTSTREAFTRHAMSPNFRILVVPPGLPRTKPRALNCGLLAARGEFIVVYDAEDRPQPDQLRKAAARFAACPDVACLQASLTIDNEKDSWLTRLFALDYAAQFDVIMRGLSALRLPMPLGGTSNHFRIDVLRHVLGWDAWNVTEDADLGLRLARLGHRTEMLASTTFEEAPAKISDWFPQRRRWMKGWMQTLLTHTRNPAILVRELGLLRALHMLTLIAAHTFGPLAGIWLTLLVLHEAMLGEFLLSQENWLHLAGALFWTGLAALGCIALVLPTFIAIARRHLWSSAPFLLLRPLHWCLLSASSIAALVDLWLRPFHWAKTRHGLSTNRGRDRA